MLPGNVFTQNSFYRLMELAVSAASLSAEETIDNIEIGENQPLHELPKSTGYLKLKGTGRIVRAFKKFGKNKNGEYLFENSFIKQIRTGGYCLVILYHLSDRQETRVITQALNAAQHVLNNVEEIQVVIEDHIPI